MNVLIVGSGGREHALGWLIAQSPNCGKLFFAYGNAGTKQIGRNISPVWPLPMLELAGWLEHYKIGFVVVGPEAPLAEGFADIVRQLGWPVFGPSRRAAEIKASKSWGKKVAEAAFAPTAPWCVFYPEGFRGALSYALEKYDDGIQVVIKADGFADGKGVVVPESREEIEETFAHIIEHGVSGDAVVIEERLSGDEISFQALCDGENHVLLPASQDYKRLYPEPEAPNTGGMGAFAPVPWVSGETLRFCEERFVRQVLRQLYKQGTPFVGCLYPGVIKTPHHGIRLLEFNARFADPETQAALRLWKQSESNDFLSMLYACATGTLNPHLMAPRFHSGRVVAVTLAAKGYPNDAETLKASQGALITGIKNAEEITGVKVFHAGTARNEAGDIVVAGGRVLTVTAVADTFAEAQKRAYEAARCISFVNKKGENVMTYRNDIGKRAEEWEEQEKVLAPLHERQKLIQKAGIS